MKHWLHRYGEFEDLVAYHFPKIRPVGVALSLRGAAGILQEVTELRDFYGLYSPPR